MLFALKLLRSFFSVHSNGEHGFSACPLARPWARRRSRMSTRCRPECASVRAPARRDVGGAQPLAVDGLLARIGHASLQIFARADRAVAGRRVGQGTKALDPHAPLQALLGGVERRLERRSPGERAAEEAELVRT